MRSSGSCHLELLLWQRNDRIFANLAECVNISTTFSPLEHRRFDVFSGFLGISRVLRREVKKLAKYIEIRKLTKSFHVNHPGMKYGSKLANSS